VNITVEQTPKQKLSDSIIDKVNSVSIVHLPGIRLSESIRTATSLRRSNSTVNIIPHIAARNIKNKQELFSSCERFQDLGISDVLLIGGGRKTGDCYGNTDVVLRDIQDKGYSFQKIICGVYPQKETIESVQSTKYKYYSGGITQLCFNLKQLRSFSDSTTIGVPSNCSLTELFRFVQFCGIAKSTREMLCNLKGAKYMTYYGFNTAKFVADIEAANIHVFNFGNLEKTIESLVKKIIVGVN